MKITRLTLARYGHLSDVELRFDPDVALHVVLGGNETGKSTALAAVADALFGFPHQSDFAFLHGNQSRVAIELLAADGRAGCFVRLKRRLGSLVDAEDTALPESAIATFLGGTGRERFAEFFGMDAVRLRRGGEAILQGEGEVGASLLLAQTGLRDVRGAAQRLKEQAGQLYGSRSKGAFNVALAAFKDARDELDRRTVPPTRYAQARDDLEKCQAEQRENRAQANDAEAERSRLERVRRTASFRCRLAQDRLELAGLSDVRPLPADAEQQYLDATQKSLLARAGLERNREDRDKAAMTVADSTVDPAVLAVGDEIDRRHADLSRVEALRDTRASQLSKAERSAAQITEMALRLGLAADVDAVAARFPGQPTLKAADRALQRHTALATTHDDSARQREANRAELRAAQNARQALPAAPEAGPYLAAAIEQAKNEGRIDQDCLEAEIARRATHDALERALAGLPLWQGSVEALAAAPLPLEESRVATGKALDDAQAALLASERALAEAANTGQATAADLAAVLAGGTPPSAAAVAALRDRRDRAWGLIRRHYIESGPPATPTELHDLPADLAEGLTLLMGEADALADRRTAEAERVARHDQLREEQARLATRIADAERARDTAQTKLDQARAHWEALWQPVKLMPLAPGEMRAWVAQRGTVLTAFEAARNAEDKAERLREQRAKARLGLVAALPPEAAGAEAETETLAVLLRVAEARRVARDAALQAEKDALKAVQAAEQALWDAEDKWVRATAALEDWRRDWDEMCPALSLPPGTGPEAGSDAVAAWKDIDTLAAARRNLLAEIAEADRDLADFDGAVRETTRACGEADQGAPAEMLRTLSARLSKARLVDEREKKLRESLTDFDAKADALSRDAAEAEDNLAVLRRLAGAKDDAALVAAIERGRQHATLVERIAKDEEQLRQLDDGLGWDALVAEAEDVDVSTLTVQLEGLQAKRDGLRQRGEQLAAQESVLESKLRDMERGHDAGEAAQRMHAAIAEVHEVAERYARVRCAERLLTASIERFRREQQEPLLTTASKVFNGLTGGRYVRLVVDEDSGKLLVKAKRPDGTECPVIRLSEGTRDQLYLALRLAAIHIHDDRSEPLPFLADDLLASFDDIRARAALRVLGEAGAVTQTILFTHHAHIAELARAAPARVHELPSIA